MSELIIKEEKSAPLDLSKPSGMAKWLSDHSGGLITEKSSALIILAVAVFLIIFSVFYFFQNRPKVDTQKNFYPAIIEQ